MSFDEVRLPTNVEKGAVGGPMFNTTVLELTSGPSNRYYRLYGGASRGVAVGMNRGVR